MAIASGEKKDDSLAWGVYRANLASFFLGKIPNLSSRAFRALAYRKFACYGYGGIPVYVSHDHNRMFAVKWLKLAEWRPQ